jgi:hypothetical protein
MLTIVLATAAAALGLAEIVWHETAAGLGR